MIKKLLSLIVMILAGLGFGMLFTTVVSSSGNIIGNESNYSGTSAWLGWGENTLGEGSFGGYFIFFGLIIIFLIAGVMLLLNLKKEAKIILGFVAFVISIVIAIFAFMGTSTFMVSGDTYETAINANNQIGSLIGSKLVEVNLGAGAYIIAFSAIAIALVLLLELFLSSKTKKKRR